MFSGGKVPGKNSGDCAMGIAALAEPMPEMKTGIAASIKNIKRLEIAILLS